RAAVEAREVVRGIPGDGDVAAVPAVGAWLGGGLAAQRGRRLVDVDAADAVAGRVAGCIGDRPACRLVLALAERLGGGAGVDAGERVAASEADRDVAVVPVVVVRRAIDGRRDRRRRAVDRHHGRIARLVAGVVDGL